MGINFGTESRQTPRLTWRRELGSRYTNIYLIQNSKNKTSTMVGTRRSNPANTPSQFRPPRKRNNYTPTGTISRGTEPGPCLGQLSRDLLDASFMRMRPHIWYSILPSEDGRDDISSGTRQRWEYLLPLLIHASLIQKNEKSSNGFDVITTKWNDFFEKLCSHIRRGKAKQYHICLAKLITRL